MPGEETGLWPGAACRVEFDAFLECGILAHGFLRVRYGECGHDKLLAARPQLVTPVLKVVQRVITRHLLDAAEPPADDGQGGAVTRIQNFGSAGNLNIHLHCLVLDGSTAAAPMARRPSSSRVQLNAAGQVELKLKTPWRNGTMHRVMSPLGPARLGSEKTRHAIGKHATATAEQGP